MNTKLGARMDELQFVRFGQDHTALYAQWCEDAETKRWLGTPTQEWLDYVLTTDQSFTWMVYDGDVPVGQLQIDPLEGAPTVFQVSCLVAPQQRRKGYGRRILLNLLERAELKHVTEFYAWVNVANTASRALLLSSGYEPQSSEPDKDGYIKYVYVPSSA